MSFICSLLLALVAFLPLHADSWIPSASAERIARDLAVLCGYSTQRVPGTAGFAQALEYSESELQRLGLPTRRQQIEVHRWEAGHLTLQLLTPEGEGPALVVHALGRSGGALLGTVGVLDLARGSQEDLRQSALLVPGKLLLMEDEADGERATIHRLEKVDRAATAGGAAVLFTNRLGCQLQGVVAWNGSSAIPAYSTSQPEILKSFLEENAALRIRAQVKDVSPGVLVEVPSANLIAEIRGVSHPDEQILVSAHLDAWNLGQGALDNAAGVSVLLETARILSAATASTTPPKISRTIRFVLFTGEELGLEGSRAYLDRVHVGMESPPSVVLNLEMCEGPAGFVVHSGRILAPLLGRLVLEHRNLGLSAGVQEALDLYSDHMPFLLEGIPSFTLAYHRSENAGKYVHTVHDRIEHIDPSELARSADLVAAALLALADHAVPIPAPLGESALRELFESHGRELDRVRERGY